MTEENTARAGRPEWRGKATSAGPVSPARTWTIRLVCLAACGLALAGVLIGILLNLRPRELPFLTAVPITEYGDPRLPANAFALQDAKALVQFFPEHNELHADVQQYDQLQRYLNSLGDRGHETLIVYLSALAVRRGAEVYILAGNTNPAHPDSGVPLTKVLKSIANVPGKKRLVLLDLMQPVAGADIGILSNDVAEGVQETVNHLDERDLWVLSACSPGEVSLPAETLQKSAFGYYLCQALAGHADGCGPHGKVDGLITLSELTDFVRTRVQRWARENRATSQTPVLLPPLNDAGFTVATVPREPPADDEAAETYPPELAHGWAVLDTWRDQQRYRFAPEVFTRLQANLLEAQQRNPRGAALKDLMDALRQREEEWSKAQSEAGLDSPPPRPFTLALTPEAAADIDQIVVTAFTGLQPLPTKPPPDQTTIKAFEEARKGLIKSFTEAKKSPETVAWAVFNQLADEPRPTFERVQLGSEIISAMKPSRSYVETTLLERLVKHGEKEWAPALVHDLLAALRAEGQILAGDPRAVIGSLEELQKAATLRRRTEKGFLTPDEDAELTNNETPAAGVLEAYRPIRDKIAHLTRAYQLRDQARGLLPGLLPYPIARHGAAKEFDERLRDAVGAYVVVDTVLEVAKSSPMGQIQINQPDRFEDALTNLSISLRNDSALRKLFQKADMELLGKPDAPHPRARYHELQARLASPLVGADVRATAWKTARELATQLCKQTQEQDDKDNSRRSAGDTPRVGEDRERPWDRAAITVRAWAGVYRLQLAGAPEAARLADELTRLERPASPPGWSALAQQLGNAFAKDAPEQTKRAQELREQYRTAHQRLWGWLHQHYQAEFDNLPKNSKYRNLYEEAVTDYQRAP